MLIWIEYLILGLIAGIFGGVFGLGGGTIIIPGLVYLFRFSQHLAQGTSLAVMIPPIGILAAWKYYQNGYVDIKAAPLICLGFLIGGLIGASVVQPLSDILMRRLFGLFLLAVSMNMIFGK